MVQKANLNSRGSANYLSARSELMDINFVSNGLLNLSRLTRELSNKYGNNSDSDIAKLKALEDEWIKIYNAYHDAILEYDLAEMKGEKKFSWDNKANLSDEEISLAKFKRIIIAKLKELGNLVDATAAIHLAAFMKKNDEHKKIIDKTDLATLNILTSSLNFGKTGPVFAADKPSFLAEKFYTLTGQYVPLLDEHFRPTKNKSPQSSMSNPPSKTNPFTRFFFMVG